MANTLTSLVTAFKYVQEQKLNDLKPNSSIIYDMAPMKDSDTLGRKYLCPVVLSYELGFTFGDGLAFAYNDDVAGVYDEIEVDPSPVVLKSRLSIEAADRMARSEKAMISHVALRSGQMKTSLLKMAEIEMLHGRVGVGIVSGSPAITAEGGANDLAACIMTAASWAPGVWAGMEGAILEVRSSGGTKRNSSADLTLVSINFDTRTLNIRGVDAEVGAIVDTDIVYFKGAYSNGQYGLKYQLDTSGSVFGVDSSAYALWKAQEVTVSGALTMEQVLKGRAKAVSRGGLDEDSALFVSSLTYENLNSDLSALRAIDGKLPNEGENGFEGLVYHGQGGKIRIIAHPMMKEGEAFMIPEKGMKRIGSTDITFKNTDGSDDAWQHLEGYHAYQLTGRYSFQILLSQPAKCVLFSAIVNS